MKFTVVMASFLGNYPTAAKGREGKIYRAVESVLNQSHSELELNVVADGCEKTLELMKEVKDERLNVFYVKRTGLFAGTPRNKGIEEATGDVIVYLDIDDVFGENHLKIINDNFGANDWVWFNDIRFYPMQKAWFENECNITQVGGHGTSNVAHRKGLDVSWSFRGYAHDYHFVKSLHKFKRFAKIQTPEYYVCHLPGSRQSGGYDL